MAEYIKIYYKKFWEHAKVLDRATPFSAGSDLYSAFEYCIPREGQATIDTGIGAVIPPTHQGHIYSKSKLAYERSLHIGAGVVEPEYTGPIFVVLCNPTKKDELIKQGEAVAQIVYQRIALPIYVEIEELPITKQGNHGLGTDDTTKWLPNQT